MIPLLDFHGLLRLRTSAVRVLHDIIDDFVSSSSFLAGITVQDIFEAISYNFSRLVHAWEFDSWDDRRQAQAGSAYWNRTFRHQAMNPYPHLPIHNDGLQRVDYLGDRVMFRGLEPSPRMDGTWMLFVGPI